MLIKPYIQALLLMPKILPLGNLEHTYIVVAVGSSGILKGKQKLGVTFNSNQLDGIDFTKFSKLTMCSA